ncbi:MAG TPA: RsmE family RNA methyltransferase [Vicinamibacterales bacterium]|nr:RsmE family RNA methyltransferase [Vicinamibacterales bacterium]
MTHDASRSEPRFLVGDLGQPGDEIALPAGEARQLTRVLRLGIGDTIVVFDGRGHEFSARVAGIGRDSATAVLITPLDPAPEPVIPFTIAQALLKGPSMDDVVRDAVMIGAEGIEPVVTAHVAAKPPLAARRAAVARWRRIAIASAKQARRAFVPAVSEPCTLAEWLGRERPGLTIICVEPSAGWQAASMRDLQGGPAPQAAALLIGPEGGWTREEIRAAADAGAVPVTLGSLTLRADAVALTAGALFRILWEG